MKISHGFKMNKTKNDGYCSHGNHKFTMILLIQTIIYKVVLRCFFFCGYKNRPTPTVAFQMI